MRLALTVPPAFALGSKRWKAMSMRLTLPEDAFLWAVVTSRVARYFLPSM